MGFFDNLGKALGESISSSARNMNDSYNRTSSEDLSSMSDYELNQRGCDAIRNKDYGAAKAYSDELKRR